MKKFKIAPLVVAMALAPTLGFAQSKADNFKGFNFSLGASLQQSTMDAREHGNGSWNDVITTDDGTTFDGYGEGEYSTLDVGGNFNYDRTTALPSRGQILPEVELGYNFKVSNNFLLGMSIGADFGKKKSRSVNRESNNVTNEVWGDNYCDGDCSSGEGGEGTSYSWESTATGSYRVADRTVNANSLGNKIFIALKPSYAVTDSTMIFAKVSYNQSKADLGTEKVTVRGVGFGAGFETNLSKNWFLRGEIESVKYSGDKDYVGYSVSNSMTDNTNATNVGATNSYQNAKLSVDAKTVAGKIALGYRF
jgi:hypothetical protein